MNLTNINKQTVNAEWLTDKRVALDVLRLDKIDDVVSGNKWFKLKYYFQEAITLGKTTIATFGGAWSNHIIATAYACKEAGLKSIGIIRGEQSATLSPTLLRAIEYGMELIFVSRENYRRKDLLVDEYNNTDWYWVSEGGYGRKGAEGAAEILDQVDKTVYTHFIAAVGTGTMLAGLVMGASTRQKIIGISSMKGNFSLDKAVVDLLQGQKSRQSFEIFHDYHFGGYGKHPTNLIQFMNETYKAHQLPLDIVYTGKTFFAIQDLVKKDFFEKGSKLLMIHSGGLQANCSLPPQVLAF